MVSDLIYLDNAASTAVRPEVLDEVIQILSKQYGNPSSIHGYGRAAEKTINIAASDTLLTNLDLYLGKFCLQEQSNNMAIHGVMVGSNSLCTMLYHCSKFSCKNPACSTTRAETFSVPERMPSSCPPPKIIGSSATFSYVKCSNTLGAVYFMRGY